MDMSQPYDGSSNCVEEIRCSSVEEFLEKIKPRWDDITSPDFNDFLVYRGHYDAGWELLPAAWREDGKQKLASLRAWLAPRIEKLMPQSPKVEHAVQVASEVYAVRQFCDLADELGLLIPQEGDLPELNGLLSQLSRGFVTNGIFVQQMELFIDMPFAIAQHHGIPTRYLDWTRDPFVAALFATEESSQARISPDICVWKVDLREKQKVKGLPPEQTPPLHWVRVPRGLHGYVHAQSGVFLLCGGKSHTVSPWTKSPHLPMKKYLLDRREAKELRKRLYGLHRYSKAHLMPTLDNVFKTIADTWEWLAPTSLV